MTDGTVLIVEDDAHLREALFDSLSGDSVRVLTADSGSAALDILGKEDIGLVVSDLQMQPMDGTALLQSIRATHPELPAVLMTAYGTIENAVDVMRDGAADYLVKPFSAEDLKAVVSKHLKPRPEDGERPVAADPRSRRLLRIAARVAGTDATVMINGESGAGKEVLAQYIHARSARSDGPFVAINCAAIPENMLEAVLFGHEKGAFTGATQSRPGKFEQANGGTLLLDEISEMDIALQAKLLRVIQEKEVERLGGNKLCKLDVRVLATTNRNLKQCVSDGRFREDLYYRLNVFPLLVPPLRERVDDIVPLAELFIARSGAGSVTIAACARRSLLAHPWPGNVRELDNVIQRSLILLRGQELRAEDIAYEPDDSTTATSNDAGGTLDGGLQEDLEQREFQLIIDALEASHGRRGAAARALDISPRTLRYKLARMRDHGIEIPGDRHE
ncbi:MAG: sigma-54 dependent transcriptional regulator [Pseudomonadota bacterium]